MIKVTRHFSMKCWCHWSWTYCVSDFCWKKCQGICVMQINLNFISWCRNAWNFGTVKLLLSTPSMWKIGPKWDISSNLVQKQGWKHMCVYGVYVYALYMIRKGVATVVSLYVTHGYCPCICPFWIIYVHFMSVRCFMPIGNKTRFACILPAAHYGWITHPLCA